MPEANFKLETSIVDNRTYRYVQLDNGLRAILISSMKENETLSVSSSSEDDLTDADDCECDEHENGSDEERSEKKSAAALCIQVGSFSDPAEAQGLSHFLEHMVFMGSERYPMENDFDAYLSRRGGQSNAWTGNEYTLFHFDVQRKHFIKCLDRFAHFFISPLLQRDSSDRELAAVHSEYELSHSRDSNRLQYFIAAILASIDSPYRIFGQGNLKSLKTIPEEQGTDIYSLLQNHRKTSYSSHRMTLAVQSRDTLDHLEEVVRKLFSRVPNSGVPPLDFSRFVGCFDTPAFNKFYRVCPLGDREKLRLVWALPPLHHHYESTPMCVLTSLVGHEGKGSVLALLKEKNLAVSLSCGAPPASDFEHSSLCTLFVVHITLTDDGWENVNQVCGIVFDYFKVMLRAALDPDKVTDNAVPNGGPANPQVRVVHSFHSYLVEYQKTHEAAFLYSEVAEPEDTVVQVANMMHLVPPEHVYSAYVVLKKIDVQLYVDLLKLFTPDRAAIILLSRRFASSITPEMKVNVESWYDIRYTSEDISDDQLQQWKTSVPNSSLHLPYHNIFLTSNFDLLPAYEDINVPIDLNATKGGEYRRRYGNLWFQQSTRFKSPKASFIMHFWSPLVLRSKENLVLHMLLNYTLNQTLHTIAYEGGEANLSYAVDFAENGLKISLHGFNEKLYCFYKSILDHILDESLDASIPHFESHRDAIRQLSLNQAMKPEVLNSHLQFYLLRKDAFLFDDLLSSLQNLSLADLLAYKQSFFGRLRLTAYAHGNLTPKEAINFFDYTTNKLTCTPLPQRKFSDVACYAPGFYQLRVMNCNPADINMCIAQVHLLGQADLTGSTYNELLAYLLSEPAFDYLRTKETLGYQAGLRSWRSFPGGPKHSGILLLVCSPANMFSASHVAGRLSAFWYRIAPRILSAITPDAFQTAVNSLIAIKQLEDPNMMIEVERNWSEIASGEFLFNRREASVQVLETITKESLLDFFYRSYLDHTQRRTLAIQIDAPTERRPDCMIPQKSYNLNIRLVKFNTTLKSDEQTSSSEVDVVSCVDACGYDSRLAEDFVSTFNPTLFNQDLCPVVEQSVFIEDIRYFRSKLTYDKGQLV